MLFLMQLILAAQRRHDRGCQALGDDEQASPHYAESTRGPSWLLWRCRVYCRNALVPPALR